MSLPASGVSWPASTTMKARRFWLNAPQKALGGLTALEAVGAGKAHLVFQLIDRLAGGSSA